MVERLPHNQLHLIPGERVFIHLLSFAKKRDDREMMAGDERPLPKSDARTHAHSEGFPEIKCTSPHNRGNEEIVRAQWW
jgi:hypothetical protein